MNVLLAPDKFKGSATAKQVSAALLSGLLSANPTLQVRSLPLSDGGDGTLEVIAQYLDLARVSVATVDPLGRPIEAHYLRDATTAYIELASASGYVLLSQEERDPLRTSTYGTGLLVKHALAAGCAQIFLLLGGSATHDLGLGIAAALGVEFRDRHGELLEPCGGTLGSIATIVLPEQGVARHAQLTLLCDVDSTLLGPRGAARVYSPQKGADAEAVEQLEHGGEHLLTLLQNFTMTELAKLSGGGAAGGIAVGLHALFGARQQSGFEMIRELTDLDEAIAWADVVVTGEGQLDRQSFEGKVVGHVAKACRHAATPCYAVVGNNALPAGNQDALPLAGIFDVRSRASSTAEAICEASKFLCEIGRELGEQLAA